jgi:hypothetical protein
MKSPIPPANDPDEFTHNELVWIAAATGLEIKGHSNIRPVGGLNGQGLLELQAKLKRRLGL